MTTAPLPYAFAVASEQACELHARLRPLCADYSRLEILAACAALIAPIFTSAPNEECRRIMAESLLETLLRKGHAE